MSRGSYAVAGLSNVWGSAVLPYRQHDLDGWPVTARKLAPFYAAVLKWMPVASQRDDLEQFFPASSTSMWPCLKAPGKTPAANA